MVLDTQSVRVAAGVPASTTGRDAGKRVPGRKRALAVDVLGLVIAVIVLAASTHDNAAGIAPRRRTHLRHGPQGARRPKGFKKRVTQHGSSMGIDVEIVQRDVQDRGFVPQPIRWRGEQTYGILILHRRMVRDYEHHPASSASRVYWAMTHTMTRRLTGTNTPTWREPQAVTA
ncbi:hypothetical protein PV664_32005 [Streptomyces sp. ME01-18a]|uniref:transposase n=1 Tax=unclassified Streptomyces TaxID=2593676 RepID=UPI0029B183FC|nr:MULTISPECIES: transposase [unclassified Streptomyces]MDX3433537.1 hypothetical protein [Streptomyces sp. ME01-18a]MDX3688527.1 hypothetical protein [Streptomyces sp. AK04-4c]